MTKAIAPNIHWKEPFNDHYINYTRDGLPISNSISDIVERILAIAESATLAHGGKKIVPGDKVYYQVNTDF